MRCNNVTVTDGMLSTHSAVHIVNLHVISTPKPPMGKRELRVDGKYRIPALHTADHGHLYIYTTYTCVVYSITLYCTICTVGVHCVHVSM